ncbi:hypothetical protein PUN28_001916 [Cardiocondyla obscurior]|uniref:Uncharacterized protein n=1 Tax=Cardiocondyla obscurior TaxID=286306 RepID=A0AAW2GRQ8_9HYME
MQPLAINAKCYIFVQDCGRCNKVTSTSPESKNFIRGGREGVVVHGRFALRPADKSPVEGPSPLRPPSSMYRGPAPSRSSSSSAPSAPMTIFPTPRRKIKIKSRDPLYKTRAASIFIKPVIYQRMNSSQEYFTAPAAMNA